VIFVTVGMSRSPFDRLLRAVDELVVSEQLVVQHGHSSVRPVRAVCHDYLSYDELARYMGRARVVITHGGVGSVALALMHGKRPIVVPRLRRFGEAVDDHQAPLARTLHRQGVVQLVEDLTQLPRVIEEPQTGYGGAISHGHSLAIDLREYLRVLIARTRPDC
jgi:beta-1,4-N-acetylglucosaminyltransferase